MFDNQFNFVAGSSGVMQVLAGSSKQALVAPLQTIAKNGYLYVYVSNESPQNVYFDDLTVTHYTGPLLQEQAYYPYGLQMQGLSDRAMLKTGNPYKYNAGSELEDEDGLDYYNTLFRKYDAQIGRFTGIDILAESAYGFTPYHFGASNPAMFNDPTGLQHIQSYRDQYGNKWHFPGVLHGLSGGYRQTDWFQDNYLGHDEGGGGGSYASNLGNFLMKLYEMADNGESTFDINFQQNKDGQYGFSFKWWEETTSGYGILNDGVGVKYSFFETGLDRIPGITQNGFIDDMNLQTVNNYLESAGYGEAGIGAIQLGMIRHRQSLSINTKIGSFAKFSKAYRVLGTGAKVFGGAGNLGSITSSYLDYKAMQSGELSEARFAFRLTGTTMSIVGSIYIGLQFGGPWGALAGAGIGLSTVAAEGAYDGVKYWHQEMSTNLGNYENALGGGWIPRW